MNGFLRQDGVTLLEVVLAMGLFAVGLMGLAVMTSGLMASNMTARQRMIAVQLAQNKLEELCRGDYPAVGDSSEENIDAAGIEGLGVFQRAVAVEEKSDPTFKEVTVTVSWRSKDRHRVALKTIVGP